MLKKINSVNCVLSIVLGFSLLSCSQKPKPNESRQVASADVEAIVQSQPPAESYEVWGPNEVEIAKKVAMMSIDILKSKQNSDGVVRRDQHPKHHGCVKANWIPEYETQAQNQLLERRRVGLFAEGHNPTKKIPAWIRFSNGDSGGFGKPDSDGDVRGLALKVMNQNETQDFLFMTSNRFFTKDAKDYLALHEAVTSEDRSKLILYLVTRPLNASLIFGAKINIDNPLTTEYFAPVPLKLADTSMRMKIVPCKNAKIEALEPQESDPNFLKKILKDSVAMSSTCFNVFVQQNYEPSRNLAEDPRLRWNEKRSPFVKVARLEIPQQTNIEANGLDNFCENVTFNPWQGHPELRPVGQINRIRKVVYDTISNFRHSKNRIQSVQPVNHDPCNGATSTLCQGR